MSESGTRRAKFLGFVAHEIKNPLATVLWSCDLLKRMNAAERGSERGEKMIDISLRSLRRMRRLVEDYFTLERLSENSYDLRRERVPLRTLIESAVQSLPEKDGIPTEGWSLELDGGVLACDGELMRKALRALLEHLARGAEKSKLSVKSRGGELHLRAETPPAPLVPPAPEERQSGDTTGAVLGFSLAVRIIEAHGGKLEEHDGGLAITLPVEN
jgi:signal transduction histidine kinase